MLTSADENGEGELELIQVDALRCTNLIRQAGENHRHAQAIAESSESLPPIVVHRASMEVVDGWHRVLAARLRGIDAIAVRYFEGSGDQAFLLALELNITHGLPLTLADRKTAALRVARIHPEWSDRRIAQTTGISHKTVGALRRSSGEIPQTTARLGRDGRIRRICTRNGETNVPTEQARPQRRGPADR